MTTDYSKISQFNEEQLGKDRKSRMSQVAMYAVATHFVYELLQNADDKDATEICFTLTRSDLVVEHNGTPFTEQNVGAITYFGKGNTDITKIGHFGLGFKSVFAYTASPKIHSGIENFVIHDLYKAAAIPHPIDLSEDRTRFVLPFNHLTLKPDYIEERALKSPDASYEEIASKLADLGTTTLLFTRKLRKIQWKTDKDAGAYIREDAQFDDATQTSITTNSNSRNFYLVYGQAIQLPDENGINHSQGLVQLAFEIDKPLAEGGRIKPIPNATLNVFFPTDKETYVGFIIQGPYRTTPSRDNVLEKDDLNCYLIDETAKLIIETLERLKDRRLLSLDVLELLPIDDRRYPPESLFHPLYKQSRVALTTLPLLPTASCGFVAANLAKIASCEWLTRAFPMTQLEGIFDTIGLRWLPTELTRNKYPALFRLLAGQSGSSSLIQDIVVDPKTIARKLTASLIEKQPDEWLISFYRILEEKRASNFFQQVPYLRLSDDSLVPPPNDTSSPTIFLPYDNETACMDFPVIKQSLLGDEKVFDFFVKTLKLTKPDPVDVLCKSILPHYARGKHPTMENWRMHFDRIINSLKEAPCNKRSRLEKELASVDFLLVVSPGNHLNHFAGIERTYQNSPDVEQFFEGYDNAFLLKPNTYADHEREVLLGLGVVDIPRVKKKVADNLDLVVIRNDRGANSRGLEGFDPSWEMDGLKYAIENPTPIRSKLLWKYLLPHSKCIRGFVESSSRQTFENCKREEKVSTTGRLLIDAEWLPDKQGELHKPSALALEDLPDDFEKYCQSANELSNKLGMRNPEELQAMIALAKGDEKRQEVLELIRDADHATLETIKTFLSKESEVIEPVSFREGVKSIERPQNITNVDVGDSPTSGVKNPATYQKKLDEITRSSISGSMSKSLAVRFSIVRETPSTKPARDFLNFRYCGKCQISGLTFPKANGENYFEAVFLVPHSVVEHLNNPGNMLCLSAEMAAKFMHASFEWIDDIESKIKRFKAETDGGFLVDRQITIRLAGQPEVITWTEQHFMRLKSLWDCTD